MYFVVAGVLAFATMGTLLDTFLSIRRCTKKYKNAITGIPQYNNYEKHYKPYGFLYIKNAPLYGRTVSTAS
jgi:hypothetical protein